jgi:two-component system chemotaxis sensor kinase CheA
MSIDMTQFHQVFFEESAEHLAEMEALLLGLDVDAPDAEALNGIFRAAHSIKGSSGTFGFNDLAEFTHGLEDLLDKLRKGEIALRRDIVDLLLAAGDLLKTMLAAHQGGVPADPAQLAELSARLAALRESAAPPSSAAAPSRGAPALPELPGQSGASPQVFQIEFIPRAAAAGQAVADFVAHLAQNGTLEIQARPGDAAVGFWSLRWWAPEFPAFLRAELEALADRDAWRIESGPAEHEAAYGFFDEAPGLSDAARGYGFFDPLPEGKTADTEAAVADDAYGFFAPLPEASAGTRAPDVHVAPEAYGFFEPLPEPGAAPAPRPPGPPVEEALLPAAAAAKEASPASARTKSAPRPAAGESSIRVSVEKVDQLINLVGELVITQAMLIQTVAQMQAAPERLNLGMAQLERNSRDLQEAVMSIRMLPVSTVFSRFPRVVHDLSAKLGKEVELHTIGDDTELDKSLVERIVDPLTHLIRNSLDHGIEAPAQRVALGKRPVGTITLKASHQGGNVVIEVRDDGAGLNRDKILAKARERGMPVSEQMSDAEVFGLIFEPGFSTAETITDVSGRGVGMDVVRRNILALGGRIDIESMPGIGTRISVRLPLTLAILDGMSVAVGRQTYILPLAYVMESLQAEPQDIKTLANQARVIQVRGEYLPVLALHELFHIPGAVSQFSRGIMVILNADGAAAALFVDALVGQHQVVIKSLEANYRRVPGISGATIMGDGHVALILDVPALVEMSRQPRQTAA